MEKQEIAEALFNKGYNCAQSTVMAFAEEIGEKVNLDENALAAMSSSFGGGMGRLREVCGVVTGMFIVAGFLCGSASPDDEEAKAAQYKLVQDMAEEFRQRNGSIICRELLGLTDEEEKAETFVPSKRTESYYASRPCARLVADGAEIAEKFISMRLAEIQNHLPPKPPASI